MSAAKHTPGPWSIERYVVDRDEREVSGWARGDVKERARVIADDHPPAFIVADMVAGGSADARLIAAAPDLLEALEGIMRSPMSTKAMLAAHAAIAKARGA